MSRERLLAGIAAPTCSGKTTLLEEVSARLGDSTTTLSFDEYDLYPSGSGALESLLKTQTIVNWEDPGLFDYDRYLEDLKKLKAGLPIVLQTRSRESMAENIESRELCPAEITIVEGVFTYHDPEARELFDIRFYIDIPPEEMIRRRLARSTEGEDPWDQSEYIHQTMVEGTRKFVEPQKKHAHFILNGLQPTETLATLLIAFLKSKGPIAQSG